MPELTQAEIEIIKGALEFEYDFCVGLSEDDYRERAELIKKLAQRED